MMKAILFLSLSAWLTAGAQPASIIPEPVELKNKSGVFTFGNSVRVYYSSVDSVFRSIVAAFVGELPGATDIALLETADSNRAKIIVRWQPSLTREAYTIDIDTNAIEIGAADHAGLFYAFQSLRQLVPVESGGKIQLPCLSIVDYPRYGYRGMHLDVSRHFFSIAFLKKYIDLLAYYKINTFHWHLTDSHGWRLEIKKYPRLTEVGAWRADRTGIPFTIAPPTGKHEKASYGGFYTQEQVRELIGYARERYITIIPEIEMPGHCTAAVVAYPQFTCLNNPVPLLIPCGYPGDLKHNFCPGNDSTFIFLQNILDEVITLFPSEYIHIGGDEVRPASWMSCPRCQQRMKDEGLDGARQLQSYFTKRIDDYITARGRKLIGWDEIMEAGISENAAVMSWRGNEGGIAAARAGHHVVMAPYRYVYFDFYQSRPALEENISYAGLQLDKVYSFDPTPAELSDTARQFIIGGQACLWTENIETPERVQYMLLPRMLALSEVLWTPVPKKNYRKFIDKAEKHFRFFDKSGINYARSMYNVSIYPEYDRAKAQVKVRLSAQTGGKYDIRYNTSGKALSSKDPLYETPLELKNTVDLRAGLFEGGTMLGKVNTERIAIHSGFGSPVRIKKSDTALSNSFRRLTDGLFGTIEPYDGRWIFFSDSALELTVDLEHVKTVEKLSVNFLEDIVGNTLLPQQLSVFTSKDGKSFRRVLQVTNKKLPLYPTRHIKNYRIQGIGAAARYIRLKMVQSQQANPENPALNTIFIDELIVE